MKKGNDRRETDEPRFVRVGRVGDFPEGRGKKVKADGLDLAVFNAGGRLFALRDECTHAAAPLSAGSLEGFAVACPRHGAQFDVRTGEVLALQAVRNVEAFEVKIEGGDVLVGTAGRLADPLWVTGRRLDQAPMAEAQEAFAPCCVSADGGCCRAAGDARSRSGETP